MSGMTEVAETANREEPPLADFLNPNSMLTPGFAGALTMMITNVLCGLFAIPVAPTGLAISALFGTLVVVSTASLYRKFTYYVLNTLIIFCVAAGSGDFAYKFSQRAPLERLSMSYTSSAHAQTATVTDERYIRALESITNDAQLTPAEKVKRITDLNREWNPAQSPDAGGFFKPWVAN